MQIKFAILLVFSLHVSTKVIYIYIYIYTIRYIYRTSTFEFAHGAVGRRIDPSWGGPIELFLVLASAPRLM